MRGIQNLRVDYSGDQINIKEMKKNPIDEFLNWFSLAENSNINEPNAMILSTLSQKGDINSRTVLLKGITKNGFIFYTNHNSKKGEDIKKNNFVSSVFLWKGIEKQVIIKGNAFKISDKKSFKYFKSRPRKSRIAAWASKQSEDLLNYDNLKERFNFYDNKFKNKEIPLPEFWGGYEIKPYSIEFWQGRSSRMHDRVIYLKENSIWINKKLYP